MGRVKEVLSVGFPKELVLSFVPLLVAIDAIGTLPIVLGLTEDATRGERLRMVNIALVTALVLGIGFLFLGKWLLRYLSIEVSHFAVAGGIVLLVLAVRDLTTGKMMEMPQKKEMMAVVPIGTPLTVGPATLATLLLLSDQYNEGVVLLAFALNVAAAWLVFVQGGRIAAFLGQGGLRALSKFASLLLAAIAVRMILLGLTQALPFLSKG